MTARDQSLIAVQTCNLSPQEVEEAKIKSSRSLSLLYIEFKARLAYISPCTQKRNKHTTTRKKILKTSK